MKKTIDLRKEPFYKNYSPQESNVYFRILQRTVDWTFSKQKNAFIYAASML